MWIGRRIWPAPRAFLWTDGSHTLLARSIFVDPSADRSRSELANQLCGRFSNHWRVESLRVAVLRMGAWTPPNERRASVSESLGEWAETLGAQLGDRALFRGGFAEHHQPMRSIRWRGCAIEIEKWWGPERISSPWNASASTSSTHSVDYWRLETTQGAWLWVAHSAGGWAMVGVVRATQGLGSRSLGGAICFRNYCAWNNRKAQRKHAPHRFTARSIDWIAPWRIYDPPRPRPRFTTEVCMKMSVGPCPGCSSLVLSRQSAANDAVRPMSVDFGL